MDVATYFKELNEDLESMPTKQDKLEALLDLGGALAPYPEDKKDENYLVQGCASTTYLTSTNEDGCMQFLGDSDSLFAKSYLQILIGAFNGQSAEFLVKDAKPLVEDFVERSELIKNLLPTRVNSFGAIFAQMQKEAGKFL